MTLAAVVVWLVLGLVSVGIWWPAPVRWTAASRPRIVVALAAALVGTGVVALLGALGTGTRGPLAWLVVAFLTGGAIAGGVLPGVSTGTGAIAGAILGGVLGSVVNGRQYYRDTRGYCYYVDQYGQPHYNYQTRC